MAETKDGVPRWTMKVMALAAIVIGFLLLASGYRYGYVGTMVGGGVLVVLGLFMLAGKIAARNRRSGA